MVNPEKTMSDEIIKHTLSPTAFPNTIYGESLRDIRYYELKVGLHHILGLMGPFVWNAAFDPQRQWFHFQVYGYTPTNQPEHLYNKILSQPFSVQEALNLLITHLKAFQHTRLSYHEKLVYCPEQLSTFNPEPDQT